MSIVISKVSTKFSFLAKKFETLKYIHFNKDCRFPKNQYKYETSDPATQYVSTQSVTQVVPVVIKNCIHVNIPKVVANIIVSYLEKMTTLDVKLEYIYDIYDASLSYVEFFDRLAHLSFYQLIVDKNPNFRHQASTSHHRVSTKMTKKQLKIYDTKSCDYRNAVSTLRYGRVELMNEAVFPAVDDIPSTTTVSYSNWSTDSEYQFPPGFYAEQMRFCKSIFTQEEITKIRYFFTNMKRT